MRFPNEIFLEIFKYLDILSCFRLLPTSYLFRLLLISQILDFANKDPGHAITALYLAALCGDKELMKLVLIKGVEVATMNGNSAHQSSDETLDVNYAVQVLVYQNSRSEIWGSYSEVSALHWTVMRYEGELLRLLYKRGLNANMKEDGAIRALHKAAFVGGGISERFLELLLENGFNVNCANTGGTASLCGNCREVVARAMLDYGASPL